MNHLLSINNYHYRRGGAEVCYFDHADLFEKNGWSNSFFSMHHDENVACAETSYFAENIDYQRAGPALRRVAHASRVIYSRDAQRKLAAMLDTRRIDVAHAHNIYQHLSPSVLVELKRRRIPVVMTAHDLKIACPDKMMMNDTGVCERCKGGRVWNVARFRCIKNSLAASALITLESAAHKALNIYDRHVDRIVTPSRFYRDKLIEWGWNGDKIVHIPNFIGHLPAAPAAPGGDYILYFGRLAGEKGLSTLVRAAAQARVPVVLAGTGPEEATLKALVARTDAPVTFAGFRSGEALWSLVEGARAVALPSEWYENGPMSTIEAFARGIPLIGARIGGITELLDDGATGWGFRSGDVDDLARALGDVQAASTATLAEKGAAARAKAATDFSPATYRDRMTALYGELGVAIGSAA